MNDLSKFTEGQKVICINDAWPLVRTTEDDKRKVGTQATNHPSVDEVLIVAEVLGEFIRFNEYHSDAVMWWHQNKFAPVDDEIHPTEEEYTEGMYEYVD